MVLTNLRLPVTSLNLYSTRKRFRRKILVHYNYGRIYGRRYRGGSRGPAPPQFIKQKLRQDVPCAKKPVLRFAQFIK